MQHLAQGSPEARDAMREAGALPVLVSVLDSADSQSARAAWAVSALASDCPANRAAFRCGNIFTNERNQRRDWYRAS